MSSSTPALPLPSTLATPDSLWFIPAGDIALNLIRSTSSESRSLWFELREDRTC